VILLVFQRVFVERNNEL